MRERVTIQELNVTIDPAGQRLKNFANVSGLINIPSHIEHIKGMETFRGHQVEAGVLAVFEMRLATVLPTNQLLHVTGGNKAYGITSVVPLEGRHEGGFRRMLVFVRAVADD